MKCVVELLGVPRLLVGAHEMTFELAPGASLRDLVGLLAQQAPALKGHSISPDDSALIEPHVFCLNGRDIVRNLELRLKDGDRLILMAAMAGG